MWRGGSAALQNIEPLLRPHAALDGEIEDARQMRGRGEAKGTDDVLAFFTGRVPE